MFFLCQIRTWRGRFCHLLAMYPISCILIIRFCKRVIFLDLVSSQLRSINNFVVLEIYPLCGFIDWLMSDILEFHKIIWNIKIREWIPTNQVLKNLREMWHHWVLLNQGCVMLFKLLFSLLQSWVWWCSSLWIMLELVKKV